MDVLSDKIRHPVLSRAVPLTVLWVWPSIVPGWGIGLFVIPDRSDPLFGWKQSYVVDALGPATIFSSVVVIAKPRVIMARIVFLVIPGFGFLGRFSTLTATDFIASAWRSRLLAGSTYALAATGHVLISAMAVMFISGGLRANDD